MIPSQVLFDCSCRASAGDVFLLEAKWVPEISFLKGLSLSDHALPPVACYKINPAVRGPCARSPAPGRGIPGPRQLSPKASLFQ